MKNQSPTRELTPRAQQLITQAQLEAQKLNHTYCGTEHILLAMLNSDFCCIHKIGIDIDKSRQACMAELGVCTGDDKEQGAALSRVTQLEAEAYARMVELVQNPQAALEEIYLARTVWLESRETRKSLASPGS